MAKHQVRIVFKSGFAQDVTCDNFAVTRGAMGEIIKLSWEACEPGILAIQLGEIAAVFKVK